MMSPEEKKLKENLEVLPYGVTVMAKANPEAPLTLMLKHKTVWDWEEVMGGITIVWTEDRSKN